MSFGKSFKGHLANETVNNLYSVFLSRFPKNEQKNSQNQTKRAVQHHIENTSVMMDCWTYHVCVDTHTHTDTYINNVTDGIIHKPI